MVCDTGFYVAQLFLAPVQKTPSCFSPPMDLTENTDVCLYGSVRALFQAELMEVVCCLLFSYSSWDGCFLPPHLSLS
jgi:hypothetical protein